MKVPLRTKAFSSALIFTISIGLVILMQCGGDDPASPEEFECGSGDVYLDGKPNEISDIVVFSNYLIYGYPAFTIDSAEQARSTDVNCNGIQCELGDFVHIIRIIVGDDLSDSQVIATDTAKFRYLAGKIEVDQKLGAVLLIFDGPVEAGATTGECEVLKDMVNGQTRVLIFSFEYQKEFSGRFLYATESPVSIEAVDYYGTPFIVNNQGPAIYFYNYPDPFYPSTNITVFLPIQSDFSITICDLFGDKIDNITGNGVGSIIIEWNADSIPDGVYIATLEACGQMTSIPLMVRRPD
jgi:hypothetical protein